MTQRIARRDSPSRSLRNDNATRPSRIASQRYREGLRTLDVPFVRLDTRHLFLFRAGRGSKEINEAVAQRRGETMTTPSLLGKDFCLECRAFLLLNATRHLTLCGHRNYELQGFVLTCHGESLLVRQLFIRGDIKRRARAKEANCVWASGEKGKGDSI